jgi:hypothetical protein
MYEVKILANSNLFDLEEIERVDEHGYDIFIIIDDAVLEWLEINIGKKFWTYEFDEDVNSLTFFL